MSEGDSGASAPASPARAVAGQPDEAQLAWAQRLLLMSTDEFAAHRAALAKKIIDEGHTARVEWLANWLNNVRLNPVLPEKVKSIISAVVQYPQLVDPTYEFLAKSLQALAQTDSGEEIVATLEG